MINERLIREIAEYMNEVNNYSFTEDEIIEGMEDIKAMIETGDKEIMINSLNEEYKNSKDAKALELIERLNKIA